MVNIWNQSAGTDHARLEAKKAELFAQRSGTPTTHSNQGELPQELGRFREFWAARPVLSVVVMMLSPIVAVVVYMSVF